MNGRLLTLVVALIAVPALAAPVPACPSADLDERHAVQCATVPGLMTSTYAGTGSEFTWELETVGQPSGTFAVTFPNGVRLFSCAFGLGPNACGFTLWRAPAETTLTGTLTLTHGAGAVYVVWDHHEA